MIVSRIIEDKDAKIDLLVLFEAFKFEMVEARYGTGFGKRLFADHMAVLFLNVVKIRVKTKQTTQTIYHGIKLKHLAQHLKIQQPLLRT